MAQLKDTLITGGLRVTDTTSTDVLQARAIKAHISSDSDTYGLGTAGQVLTSDGTNTYWSSDVLAANDAMVFKGTLGTDGTVANLPSTDYSAGWTYRVATAGTYAGEYCERGDLIIAVKDYVSPGVNTDWAKIEHNIDGAVFTGSENNVANTLTENTLIYATGDNQVASSIVNYNHTTHSLTIPHASGRSGEFKTTFGTDNNSYVSLMVGSSNTNHGIYHLVNDSNGNKIVDGWMIYADSSNGKVIVNGTAATANKLSNTSKIGDTNKPVYFTANGVPSVIKYTINANISSATAKSLAFYTSATTIGETTGQMHVNTATKSGSTKVSEELVIGNQADYFGRIALYGSGNVNGGAYIFTKQSATGWTNHVLPSTSGWLATGGNGSSTGVGSDTQTMYLSTSGVLTVGQQVHTLSGGGTVIAGGTDLNTIKAFGNYYQSATATAKTVLHNPFNDTTSLEAFTMKVFSGIGSGSSNYLIQELKTHRYGYYFTRSSANAGTDWTTWRAYAFNPKTGNDNNDCDVGSLTQPVYVKKTGEIAVTTHTLGASVPSTAVFTDKYIDVTARGITKAYLLADTTAPTSDDHSATAVAESDVYLDTTAGKLAATIFKLAEKAEIQYNTTTNAIDFNFI